MCNWIQCSGTLQERRFNPVLAAGWRKCLHSPSLVEGRAAGTVVLPPPGLSAWPGQSQALSPGPQPHGVSPRAPVALGSRRFQKALNVSMYHLFFMP